MGRVVVLQDNISNNQRELVKIFQVWVVLLVIVVKYNRVINLFWNVGSVLVEIISIKIYVVKILLCSITINKIVYWIPIFKIVLNLQKKEIYHVQSVKMDSIISPSIPYNNYVVLSHNFIPTINV